MLRHVDLIRLQHDYHKLSKDTLNEIFGNFFLLEIQLFKTEIEDSLVQFKRHPHGNYRKQ